MNHQAAEEPGLFNNFRQHRNPGVPAWKPWQNRLQWVARPVSLGCSGWPAQCLWAAVGGPPSVWAAVGGPPSVYGLQRVACPVSLGCSGWPAQCLWAAASGLPHDDYFMNETRRKPTTGRQSPSLSDKWHGIFNMPSRTDTAGHTKAFVYPVAEHWGKAEMFSSAGGTRTNNTSVQSRTRYQLTHPSSPTAVGPPTHKL